MMFLKQTYQFSFLIYVLLTYLSIEILNVAAKLLQKKVCAFFLHRGSCFTVCKPSAPNIWEDV